MKQLFWLVLISLSPGVQADPFNIYLPFKTQYTPGVMERMEMAFVLDVESARKNFQLQIASQTDTEKFIESEMDELPEVSYGFAVGVGYGFELEVSLGEGGIGSLKYDFSRKNSKWKHSVVLGELRSISEGHGGAFIPEPEEDCGFLDFFCFMDISSWFDFLCINCSEPGTYEYNYQADIKGSMFGYMQGYKYTAFIMPYWGVYYVGYNVGLKVTDNTGAENHQFKNVTTDLAALVLGTKWRLGKKESNFNKSMILNYLVYKDSTRHDGELNGELKLSFVFMF